MHKNGDTDVPETAQEDSSGLASMQMLLHSLAETEEPTGTYMMQRINWIVPVREMNNSLILFSQRSHVALKNGSGSA